MTLCPQMPNMDMHVPPDYVSYLGKRATSLTSDA